MKVEMILLNRTNVGIEIEMDIIPNKGDLIHITKPPYYGGSYTVYNKRFVINDNMLEKIILTLSD